MLGKIKRISGLGENQENPLQLIPLQLVVQQDRLKCNFKT
jgi:hypothetical protein